VHNKLTFYSVLILVRLAVASGLILFNNPFNGAPASASPGAQGVTTSSTSTAVSTSTAPVPAANGFGDDSQHGGTSDGDHDYHSGFQGIGGTTGNSTVTTTTTTTTTSIIYSLND